MPPNLARNLVAQVEIDGEFLTSMDIINYKLMFGVCHKHTITTAEGEDREVQEGDLQTNTVGAGSSKI